MNHRNWCMMTIILLLEVARVSATQTSSARLSDVSSVYGYFFSFLFFPFFRERKKIKLQKKKKSFVFFFLGNVGSKKKNPNYLETLYHLEIKPSLYLSYNRVNLPDVFVKKKPTVFFWGFWTWVLVSVVNFFAVVVVVVVYFPCKLISCREESSMQK